MKLLNYYRSSFSRLLSSSDAYAGIGLLLLSLFCLSIISLTYQDIFSELKLRQSRLKFSQSLFRAHSNLAEQLKTDLQGFAEGRRYISSSFDLDDKDINHQFEFSYIIGTANTLLDIKRLILDLDTTSNCPHAADKETRWSVKTCNVAHLDGSTLIKGNLQADQLNIAENLSLLVLGSVEIERLVTSSRVELIAFGDIKINEFSNPQTTATLYLDALRADIYLPETSKINARALSGQVFQRATPVSNGAFKGRTDKYWTNYLLNSWRAGPK